ncbi:uncharacterized protein DFL_003430 [Arthrobotrys flagrans]|uniref:F-box domain-containing protein n=1 Tax=Arthrobotrys flagrans TaxID=97331 RepID=A0A437A1T2_ARTFL|nr:hypothetical protein DFL_003430 [Arthrobotrys flagrans]
MASSFPFLTLPLELRNEIYKYLLPTPAPLLPYALQLEILPPYCPISHNLSIFRVNKQIHSESSRIFYSNTIFSIRIVLSDWQTPVDRGSTTQFEVTYKDPWAEVCYSYDEAGKGWYIGFQSLEPGLTTCKFVHDEEVESIPSHRYRNLIRHIRVDILDTRISLEPRETHNISDAARARVRKILMPFTSRLTRLLADAGKGVEVEINLVSKPFKEERDNRNAATLLPTPTETTKRQNLYKELIETTWPYTTGPWRYKLNLAPQIEQQYPGLGKKVLRWCDENNEVTEEEKTGFGIMKTRYPYLWVMKRGRFVVMEEDMDPWMKSEAEAVCG